MNLFALASFSLGIASSLLALIIFIGAKRRLHVIWGFMNIAIAVFGFGTYMVGVSRTYNAAFFSWQVSFCGIAYIGVLFYHIVHEFCNIKSNRFLLFAHTHGILFFLTSILTKWVVYDLKFKFGQFYYYQAAFVFNLFFFFWILIVIKGLIHLYQYNKASEGLKRIQGEYFFYGMLVGFGSGATTAIPSYGINIYPGWHFLVCVYAAIQTYALFRYQVLDIKLAVTRVGVFLIVYILVFGGPFYLYYLGYKLISLISMGVLATAGPFIFLYFQRKAENKILQEERRIQILLKKASIGMSSVRDIDRLLKLIVDVLKKNLHLDHAAIYLFENNEGGYALKASESNYINGNGILNSNSPLIQHLQNKKDLLLYDEMDHLSDDSQEGNSDIKEIISQMQFLRAVVIIPFFRENTLLGFIALGKRKDKETYSPELLDVLSIIGNDAAVNIENAMYIEETGKDLAQRFHESRLKTIGTLSSGMAHQSYNQYGIITLKSDFLMKFIDAFLAKEFTQEGFIQLINKIKSDLAKIKITAEGGARVTDSIKNYAKAGTKPSAILFKDAVVRTMDLISIKHKGFEFRFIEDYPDDVVLWGNASTMQEVIYNAVSNSCDAMGSKQEAIKNGQLDIKDYHPQIMIKGEVNQTMFHFEIEDNGIGMTKEFLDNIDVPFKTTKGKGTGLGVYMIANFVRESKGTFKVESEHFKWTRFKIELPMATEEQKAQLNENHNGDLDGSDI